MRSAGFGSSRGSPRGHRDTRPRDRRERDDVRDRRPPALPSSEFSRRAGPREPTLSDHHVPREGEHAERLGLPSIPRSPGRVEIVRGDDTVLHEKGSHRSRRRDARDSNVAVGGPDLWKMFDVRPVIGRFLGRRTATCRIPASSQSCRMPFGRHSTAAAKTRSARARHRRHEVHDHRRRTRRIHWFRERAGRGFFRSPWQRGVWAAMPRIRGTRRTA